MKERLNSLIKTYRDMLKKEKSQRGRYVLENVIQDLENIVADL